MLPEELAPTTMPADHPAAGVRVSRFRLIHWLGSGGTGDVWLAEDEVLGRRVAIKLPHPELVQDEHVRREFLREARAGSMLEHPGIATVYDVGDSPCGPFIAMAYVEGPSLRELAREAPVRIEEAVAWIAAACDALAHAHARELVHGDVSPGNLMLDHDGRLKVVDFGLARTLAPGVDTTRSHVHGTYPYMAPEVLRGGAPDLRSDLYALGVVLYQLVTGELPYEGKAPGAYVASVMEGHARDPRKLNGALPDRFAELLLRAIASDPGERFAGATEFARKLRAVVSGKPSTDVLRVPTSESHRRAAAPRPRVSEPETGAAPIEPESATRTLVEARLLQAHAFLRRPDQEASMDAAIRALESLRSLTPADPRILGPLARASLFKGQLARDSAWEDRAVDHVNRALAAAPDHPATLLAAADLDRIQGRHAEALERYARVLAADPAAIDAHVGASWSHERLSDTAAAEASARAAIAADPNDWRGHSRLGGYFLNRGAYARSLDPWRRVVELAPDHAKGWSSYGSALFELERFEEALEAFERSIALQPTAIGFSNAATTLYYLGRHRECVELYERAVALTPSDARAWGNLGSACRWMEGMQERSRETLDRAIVLLREQVDRHPGDATSWAWLAHWLAIRDRKDEAVTARDRAVGLAPERSHMLPVIAATYHLLGDDSEAIRLYAAKVGAGAGMRALTSDPSLDALRSRPEWTRVVHASRSRRLEDTP